jgi:SAM-dependent methyltransferase
MKPASDPKQLWEESFEAQIAEGAYNTSPVEALVRNVAYYLRARHSPAEQRKLKFLEMGCGAGPNLVWLADKGISVSGVDIASNALALARKALQRAGHTERIGDLIECSVTKTPFPAESFDGILESCVFQHLDRESRLEAFREVARLLKPGGLFVGNMLADSHVTFQTRKAEQLPDDPGSLYLADGTSKFHLTNIGLAHFFTEAEYKELLPGFSTIDPLKSEYYLPREEAKRRGYDRYLQSMWTVYAVK